MHRWSQCEIGNEGERALEIHIETYISRRDGMSPVIILKYRDAWLHIKSGQA